MIKTCELLISCTQENVPLPSRNCEGKRMILSPDRRQTDKPSPPAVKADGLASTVISSTPCPPATLLASRAILPCGSMLRRRWRYEVLIS